MNIRIHQSTHQSTHQSLGRIYRKAANIVGQGTARSKVSIIGPSLRLVSAQCCYEQQITQQRRFTMLPNRLNYAYNRYLWDLCRRYVSELLFSWVFTAWLCWLIMPIPPKSPNIRCRSFLQYSKDITWQRLVWNEAHFHVRQIAILNSSKLPSWGSTMQHMSLRTSI